ncbi:MAG: PhoU domain-containing protein [Lachnospiraceae bacterium]|nr:PhoU domain-containing protein [Lachnospiraceae bacterium]
MSDNSFLQQSSLNTINSETFSFETTHFLTITGNIERIGDHALNIAQAYAKIAMRA